MKFSDMMDIFSWSIYVNVVFCVTLRVSLPSLRQTLRLKNRIVVAPSPLIIINLQNLLYSHSIVTLEFVCLL